SGGAGRPEHLADAILIGHAEAALAASLFHYGEYTIGGTKRIMRERGIPVREHREGSAFRKRDARGLWFPGRRLLRGRGGSGPNGLGSGTIRDWNRPERSTRDVATTVDPNRQKKAVVRHRELEVDKLFAALVKLEGSDLHLKVDVPPHVRVKGSLRPLNRGPIDDEEMERLLMPMLDERQKQIFADTGGADFAHGTEVDGVRWRFRVNMLKQMGHMGLVARRVRNWMP